MSIIVSVKINDGIVMAADSATTFFRNGSPGQIYEHANKVVNLVKGLPIGVMTCGAGGIGDASIATLLKDLRDELSPQRDASESGLALATYTMADVAARVHAFFIGKAAGASFAGDLLLRVCGYSAGRPLPEVWEVKLLAGKCDGPTSIQSEEGIGLRWNGENEALNRLVLGLGSRFADEAIALGMLRADDTSTMDNLYPRLYEQLILSAAPIQDAIDLARFMVDTTKGFMRFSVIRPKTVGGPIEIAAITKHEGFKWIQRKHFYERALNPETKL